MKKLFIIILIILALVFWYMKKDGGVVPNQNIGNYRNQSLGISFSYPKILKVSSSSGMVNIFHDIAFENSGACDMEGEGEVFERLTDFDVKIKTVDKKIVETMKQESPYIPEENFINNEVVESPGFIDSYSSGKWSGYSIYEGAEGCGQTAYYFPINNSKTLVITKASIQALSGVRGKEIENEILAIPEAISREEADIIFNSIIQSLEVK